MDIKFEIILRQAQTKDESGKTHSEINRYKVLSNPQATTKE